MVKPQQKHLYYSKYHTVLNGVRMNDRCYDLRQLEPQQEQICRPAPENVVQLQLRTQTSLIFIL